MTDPDLQHLALHRLADELQPVAAESELTIAEFCMALKTIAASDPLLRTALKHSTFSRRPPTEHVPHLPELG
jgi:hypothetical protein